LSLCEDRAADESEQDGSRQDINDAHSCFQQRQRSKHGETQCKCCAGKRRRFGKGNFKAFGAVCVECAGNERALKQACAAPSALSGVSSLCVVAAAAVVAAAVLLLLLMLLPKLLLLFAAATMGAPPSPLWDIRARAALMRFLLGGGGGGEGAGTGGE
jgi:hypothetical protein